MRYTDFRQITEQALLEIDMSTSSLKRLAAKTGAQVGMEFEMYVPDVENSDSDETENDYHEDRAPESIDDIIDFFDNANSTYQITRARRRMERDFDEYLEREEDREWNDVKEDFVEEYIEEHYGQEIDEQATNEIEEENPDIDTDGKGFRELVFDRYQDLLGDMVRQELRHHLGKYQEAREDWSSNHWAGNDGRTQEEYEKRWLEDDAGLDLMSTAGDNYGLDWPYQHSSSRGSRSIKDVALEFMNAMGHSTIACAERYHGAGEGYEKWTGSTWVNVGRQKPKDCYTIEPDGSLDTNEEDSDVGLEFVSPPMPVEQMLEDVKEIKSWCRDQGCYTNKSTGLHINLSVPGQDEENPPDFVKLALLLGDRHVLDIFGRGANHFCSSALDKVEAKVRSNPDHAKALLDQMKSVLFAGASKAIHDGQTNKYTSINNKGDYIEFRSPGGDWLNTHFDKIAPTVMRFAVALDAATKPDLYREEYLKKFYKLLNVNAKSNDILKYFIDYSAGNLPAQALKSFIRRVQQERKARDTAGDDMKYYDVKDNSGYVMMFKARNPGQAMQMAREQYPSKFPNIVDVSLNVSAAPNLAGQPTEEWEIVRRDTNQAIKQFTATPGTASGIALAWLRDQGHEAPVLNFRIRRVGSEPEQPGAEYNAQRAPVPGSTADIQQRRAQGEFTGAWQVVNAAGNEVYRFSGVGNSQADANRVATEWLRSQGLSNPTGFEVLPIMGE